MTGQCCRHNEKATKSNIHCAHLFKIPQLLIAELYAPHHLPAVNRKKITHTGTVKYNLISVLKLNIFEIFFVNIKTIIIEQIYSHDNIMKRLMLL